MLIIFDVILIFAVFIVQSTILKYILIWDVKPDMILLVSVYAGLTGGKNRGVAVGAISGLIQDSMSVGIFGINTFSKGLIGYILGNIRDKILSENAVTQTFFVFLSSLFDGLFFFLISSVFLQFDIKRGSHLTYILYQTVYNVIIGHIVFLFISRIENRLFKRKRL